MDPIERCVTKRPRRTDRIRNDQRDLFSETTIDHVLVQSAGESSTTYCNRISVIIFCITAFRTTATTRDDADHIDLLAAPIDHFTQRTETPSQVRPHFDKPAARWKRTHRLFLRRPRRKPTIDVVPISANAKTMKQRLAKHRSQRV